MCILFRFTFQGVPSDKEHTHGYGVEGPVERIAATVQAGFSGEVAMKLGGASLVSRRHGCRHLFRNPCIRKLCSRLGRSLCLHVKMFVEGLIQSL